MLKPLRQIRIVADKNQPPSGGCVLKLVFRNFVGGYYLPAAFGRLCVETTVRTASHWLWRNQPPSGGCVLKQNLMTMLMRQGIPAAFGRLCVETSTCFCVTLFLPPAAFGRLCVETVAVIDTTGQITQPPSGGCVLKHLNHGLKC